MSADYTLYAMPDTPEIRAMLTRWDRSIMVGDPLPEHSRDVWMHKAGLLMTWADRDALECALFGWCDHDDHGRDRLWIGPVSWIKAGLLEDERWVPTTVHTVARLVEDSPVLTPGLAKAITVAFNQPDDSYYGARRYYRQSMPEPEDRIRTRRVSWRSRGGYVGSYRDWHEHSGKRSRYTYEMWRFGNVRLMCTPGNGRNRARVVKRWLSEHHGMILVGVSE